MFRSHDPAFQIKCFKAIQKLGFKDKTEEKLVLFGVGPLIVTAMRRYPADKKLIREACGAIRNLGGNLFGLMQMVE